LGICSGTAATTTGAVTDDADAFTMFFARKAAAPGKGGEDEAAADNVDMVIVAISTDNNQRKVIHKILNSVATSRKAVFTVFDGGAGGAEIKAHTDIEGITIFHVETAD